MRSTEQHKKSNEISHKLDEEIDEASDATSQVAKTIHIPDDETLQESGGKTSVVEFDIQDNLRNEYLRIGGVAIQYYFTCHRELWFYLNYIDALQTDDNLTIGRLIHERSHRKLGKKEIKIGNAVIDIIVDGGSPRIMEVKKSSKLLYPSTMQVKYYLWMLEKQGIRVKAEISVPKERKIFPVRLNDEDEAVLQLALKEIPEIGKYPRPPAYEKKPYCKGCAYREFCEA